MKAHAPSQNKSASVSPSTLVRSGVLQRKCACGGTPGPTGDCAGCRRQRALGPEPPSLQPKLHIGQPGDRFEREADRVADQVLRMPTLEARHPLQAEPTAGTVSKVAAWQSGGQSMDAATRGFMEERFGHDFSGVRIHTGARAAEAASAVQARAFTMGHSVVFGSEQYRPGTADGRRLLAHELTHVVQQQAMGPTLQRETCKNQSAVDKRIKANPRGYDLTKVTMRTHVIASGNTLSGLASQTKKDNQVTSAGDLSAELQKLNEGLGTGSIGNCAILITGWTSPAFSGREKRINCDERIESFKKDANLKTFTQWERETVQGSDRGYASIVSRVKTRKGDLFTGRSGEYAKFVEGINDPWIGALNEGECVALPVGWVDPNIGALPAKPADTGPLTGDAAHVIATVFGEQTRTTDNAKTQQEYIWYAIRHRVVSAARGPDLKSVVTGKEFHAIGEQDYKAALADLKKAAPTMTGVQNARKAVLNHWDTALPADSGKFYFHWRPKATKTAENCYQQLPKGDRGDAAKRLAQEKKCAWKHAKEVVIGSDPGVPESEGWHHKIPGDHAAPDDRVLSMYVYS